MEDSMRTILAVAVAALIAGTAHAQYGSVGSAAGSAARATGNAVESGAKAAGKAIDSGAKAVGNVFSTEGQAKAKIEASGYNNVTGLNKDSYGVWHGKAEKDGNAVNVSLDSQGNIKTE
jgi:hypothetical protein